MSRFAFVRSAGGDDPPEDALQRMTGAMAETPAGTRHFRRRRDADVGMAVSTEGNEGEPAADRTSAAGGDEDVWLAFDGRLDDRTRLFDALVAAGWSARDLEARSDDALVLAAWRIWREGCVEKLAGDYALVLWDPRLRTVFCARDIAGIRPFFFHASRRIFAAASELRAVLALSCVSHTPNEAMVAEYLALRVHTQSDTLYRDIARLPPAHCLRIRGAEPEIWRYWSPRVAPDPRLRGEAADEAIRACLRAAVRDRLPSDGSAGIDLSGGLDSSTVAAVARELEPKAAAPFETLSLVFPGRRCDESAYIGPMERTLWVSNNPILGAPMPYDALVGRTRAYRDFPGHPNGLMAVPLFERARARRLKVELTGAGGDDWWSGPSRRAAALDRLSAGDLRGALSLAGLTSILRGAVGVRLPPWARDVKQRARRSLLPYRAPRPRWLAPALAREVDRRAERANDAALLVTHAQRDIFRSATLPWTTHAFEMQEREAAAHGVEQRHPFWDRRLIELALALPDPPPYDDAPSKPALRRAVRGLLPEEVRARPDKTTFREVAEAALDELVARQGSRPSALAGAGWVDADEVEAGWREVLALRERKRRGAPPAEHEEELLWSLWMVFALELWATFNL